MSSYTKSLVWRQCLTHINTSVFSLLQIITPVHCLTTCQSIYWVIQSASPTASVRSDRHAVSHSMMLATLTWAARWCAPVATANTWWRVSTPARPRAAHHQTSWSHSQKWMCHGWSHAVATPTAHQLMHVCNAIQSHRQTTICHHSTDLLPSLLVTNGPC